MHFAGVELAGLYTDAPASEGADRPNAIAALQRVRSGHEVLIVVRSEALPGDLDQLTALTAEALHSAFDVVAIDIGVDTTSDSGRVVANYLLSLAELDVPEAAAPLPPAELRYRVAGAGNAMWFHRSGYSTLLDFETGLAALDRSIESFSDILDFGCGSGRVMRHLAGRVEDGRLTGVDIDQGAVTWLRSALAGADVRVTGGLPPLPFEDGAFDLVLGYSVFSHLDRRYQDAWLAESAASRAGCDIVVDRERTNELRVAREGPPAGGRRLAVWRRRFARRGFVFSGP